MRWRIPATVRLRVAEELVLRGIQVSSGGVRGVWQRHSLLTKHDRLLRLEKATAERQLTLSAEQIKLLDRFSPEYRERHIEAPHTGALVAVDTFFVGVLKGVAFVAHRARGRQFAARCVRCRRDLRVQEEIE
jgi:hypothetical protein